VLVAFLAIDFLPDPTNILFYEKIYASTINPYDIDVDPNPSSNADVADATDS
jgi:hypothetical protein